MLQDDFIVYGDVKHGSEFQRLDQITKDVAQMASIFAFLLFKQKLMTTSIFRKKKNDSGIHEQFRAIDFAPLARIAETYRLIQMINDTYIYDPLRPQFKVAAENPFHGTNVHLHIQTHFSTTVLSKEQNLQILTKASKDKLNFQPT